MCSMRSRVQVAPAFFEVFRREWMATIGPSYIRMPMNCRGAGEAPAPIPKNKASGNALRLLRLQQMVRL